MGTVLEKANKIKETKNKLKEIINDGGGQITNDTVFDDYADEIKNIYIDAINNGIENIYNNFPKITEEGSKIILNTEEGPMKITLKGNISQDGTPTPDNSIPIKKVTGNNTIKIKGKNLFGSHCNLLYKNTGTWTNDGTSVTGSTTSGGYALYDLGLLNDYIGKTLTFSFSNTPATTYRLTAFVMCENDGSNRETVSGSTLGTNSSLTVTIPSGYTQTRLAIRLYLSNVSSGTFNNIQIEQNSTATSYEPYYIPQSYPINLGNIELCKIGNYSDEFALSTGKNLFDGIIELGTINSSGIPLNDNNALRSVNYIPVQSNTQYTFNNNKNYHTYLYEYDENKDFISATTGTSATVNPFTFITSATTKFIKFRTYGSNTENDLTVKLWLNKGNTASIWEPYGIGNWYLKNNIGKVVLDGTENWSYQTAQTRFRWQWTLGTRSNLGYCYSYVVNTNLTNDFTISIQNNNIFIKDSRYTTSISFKEWLTTNNVYFYYVLATPTSEPITDTTLIQQLENINNNAKSYSGTTIIECSSSTDDNETIQVSTIALKKID